MEYFRILNLNREPFSNSPEPDFFYLSSQHRSCLQHLELAIRLRRGLNVVIGEVGTGKTTLCRQLIMKFANPEEGEETVQTHLMMDPAFNSALEFLYVVAASLGLDIDKNQTGEWQIKEKIKHYLFENCVDRKQTVVLIIDEGQKLPDCCLEILREFLNYETNQSKLLQIVIFAQKEFQDIIERYPNFKDRVNRFCFLEPLNFRETSQMILYRLEKAGNGGAVPELFTLSGLWAVYHYSGGYPRKIITLCHQVMLSLIIQNRTKANFFLIRSCAKRAIMDKYFPMAYRKAFIVFAAIFIFFSAFWVHGRINGDNPLQSNGISNVLAEAARLPAGTIQMLSGILGKGTSIDQDASMKERPVTLGVVRIGQGYTVNRMIQEVYGNYDEGLIRDFMKLNPHISDINRVHQGDSVKIPAVPARSNPFHDNRRLIKISEKRTLSDALDFMRLYPQDLPPIKLLSYWNKQEGLVFAVVISEQYGNTDSALSKMHAMTSPPYLETAEVLSTWRQGTEFYVR